MKQKITVIDSKFYQECKVIILPTKDITRIGINPKRLSDNKLYYFDMGAVASDCQHLYFISDEEIKDDWVIHLPADNHNKPFHVHINGSKLFLQEWNDNPLVKKIIATTDEKLGITRPSNEFLKRYCEKGGIDTVLIEVENGKPYSTSGKEFGALEFAEANMILKVAPDNTITIRSIQKSQSQLWDEAFRVLWNRDVSEGTKEAMIREKYNITLKNKS